MNKHGIGLKSKYEGENDEKDGHVSGGGLLCGLS